MQQIRKMMLDFVFGPTGMYTFEHDPATGTGFADYGSALWWTAMILVTMGSDYWPRTGEGRLLCLLLAIYGYSVFGYITGSLASFFISSDARLKSDANVAVK
jgi:voltage-gated potassium channel